MYDTVVVGGGQAGLATAYQLKKAGLNYLVLHAGTEPTGSWPRYYDSLTLFSPARYANLPGMQFPGNPDRYPRRDEVVEYLREYAERFNFPIKSDTTVSSVTEEEGRFCVTDSKGETYQARTVVAASGSFNNPYIPHLPNQDGYVGERIHAIAYRRPGPYEGKRVVVVGAANSAIQIAVELASVARVTLAVRGRIRFVPQRILGKDIHFWGKVTGLDYTRLVRDQNTPVMDSGAYQAAIRSGNPDVKPMFNEFTPSGLRWADGTEEHVDSVIFATGYRANMSYLTSLNPEGGGNDFRFGVSRSIPGLYCVGYSGQRRLASANLRGVGSDSAYIMPHLKKHIRRNFAKASN
jgi:putative flavoprotein involved in K+ transport